MHWFFTNFLKISQASGGGSAPGTPHAATPYKPSPGGPRSPRKIPAGANVIFCKYLPKRFYICVLYMRTYEFHICETSRSFNTLRFRWAKDTNYDWTLSNSRQIQNGFISFIFEHLTNISEKFYIDLEFFQNLLLKKILVNTK